MSLFIFISAWTFDRLCTLTRRRQWHPTPVLLPGRSHGWRSLVGCSPWGHEESDMTEQLHFHFHALQEEMATYSSVLAQRIPGSGEPGGLSYGVAQSQTQLKRLSSSSSSIVILIFISLLAVMSIFLCAYWPSVCPLWRNVYLGVLPVFHLGFLLLLLYEPFCLFQKLGPVVPITCKYFLPVHRFFVWFMVFFAKQKLMSLTRSHLFIFVFYFYCLGRLT